MEVKVGILAIGNEVVEGQITNRNASWLAEQIEGLGAQNLYHLSCRDQDQEIASSLKFLSENCQLILTCGGLGPTRDDFTRQSLARWLEKPLLHNEAQWEEIKNKLNSRQVTLREGHKNQALIPENATVLQNPVGVAPGFFVPSPNGFLASLPGPPSELQKMFLNELKPLIEKHLAPKKSLQLKTWICLGAPESEIAHIVESLLGDQLEFGFRLHKPYVEVKVWTPEKASADIDKRIQRMEEKLSPWLVARKISDIRNRLYQKLEAFNNVYVIDQLTSGLFLDRLKEGKLNDHLRYQCFENKLFRHYERSEVESIIAQMGQNFGDNVLCIWLFPKSENSAFVSLNQNIEVIDLPLRMPIKSKIGLLYIIEKCFLGIIDGKENPS